MSVVVLDLSNGTVLDGNVWMTFLYAGVVLFCSAGVEVAAALVGKAKTVTVVDLGEAPFQLALGKEVGSAVGKVCLDAATDSDYNNDLFFTKTSVWPSDSRVEMHAGRS